MQYLNFDLEIEPGSGRDYPVAVRSQAGETHAILRFPFDELALKDALKDLQIALLRSSGLRRQVLLPEAQTVQTFGQRLFETLFTGEVLGLYDVNRSEAARQGVGVRLRLRILAPELAALPWEYLYDARLGSYTCLSRNTPLVRYMEVAQAIQPLKVKPPLRILGVIASPGDQDQLDIERERRRMQEALSGLEQEGLVKLTWLEGQTWRDLQRAMRGGPWHIFHFIGHGGFNPRADEEVLALANEQGGTHLLSATQVGILLADHPSLRLALLNACEGARGGERDLFSSTSATLARRGIPAVLAMQYEITDRAAIEFTRAFYETLAGGMPVDEAVSEARKAIELGIANTLEWGTPVLYLRATDGILFDLPERPPSAIIQRHKTISRNLDTAHQSAAPSVTCPACGEALPATAIFCGKCGTRMAAAAPAPSAAQPAAAATPTLPVPTGEQIKQKMLLSRRKVLLGLGAAGLAAITGGTTLLILFRTTTPTYRGHTDAVTALEWSPDGKLIASASYDTTIQVWNASELTQLFTYRGHRSKVWALTWAPDQQRIASASDDHTAQVWDALTGKNSATYNSHTDALRAVAWSPDGLKVASGSYDKTVQVWDATTLQTLLTYSGHSGHVWAARWSADGQHLASASADMTAQVWEPASGTLITTYPGHTGPVVALDWSPDNIHIATGSYDHTVQIWDARTGFHVLTYQGHSDLVLGVAWSPDGQHIASASQDKTVRVWDATTGQTLKVYSGHSSTVRALAWSPDGKQIASGSYDHTVQVWPAGQETGANSPQLPSSRPSATATSTPPATATPTPPVPAAASPTPTVPPEATATPTP